MNTKKLTTISLFIFWAIVVALLVAGLLFYQDKQTKNNQVKGQTKLVTDTLSGITLDIKEITKHNKSSDCWLLINGKVYDITSYFGKHPGGNSTMSATCGTDATNAYMTQDPYATSSKSRSAHSSRAKNLLDDYYLGDFGQTINK